MRQQFFQRDAATSNSALDGADGNARRSRYFLDRQSLHATQDHCLAPANGQLIQRAGNIRKLDTRGLRRGRGQLAIRGLITPFTNEPAAPALALETGCEGWCASRLADWCQA